MKFLGIDLGWSTGGTGLALVNSAGALVASTRVVTDSEIDAWIANSAGPPLVVGVDAPLVVPNDTGARAGERELAKAYGRFGAAPYSSSKKTLGEGPTRAMRLAQRHGWSVDPKARLGVGATVCLEVYPHPALVSIFELPYRLAYKKGTVAERRAGQEQLVRLLESVPELRLADSWRWPEIRRIVEDPSPGELDRLEDELDAIVCAHVAWLWHTRRPTMAVYGSFAEGYIVAPVPPRHEAKPPGAAESEDWAEVFVEGAPPERETADEWAHALREAFDGSGEIGDGPLEVRVDFLLDPQRLREDEAMLDVPLSVTVDALTELLAAEGGFGRVGHLVASKHSAVAEGLGPGVRIRLRPFVPDSAQV